MDHDEETEVLLDDLHPDNLASAKALYLSYLDAMDDSRRVLAVILDDAIVGEERIHYDNPGPLSQRLEMSEMKIHERIGMIVWLEHRQALKVALEDEDEAVQAREADDAHQAYLRLG